MNTLADLVLKPPAPPFNASPRLTGHFKMHSSLFCASLHVFIPDMFAVSQMEIPDKLNESILQLCLGQKGRACLFD